MSDLFFITFAPDFSNYYKSMTKHYSKKGLLTVVIGSLVLSSCGTERRQTSVSDYATQTIEVQDAHLSRDFSATIRGRQDIDIYPQVSGKITAVKVVEGEQVRRGQTLFVIDQVPYDAALRMAEANVLAAKAARDNAQLSFDSKKMLRQKDVISDFELNTSENALHSAEAALAQAEAALISARNDYSYTTVTSPSDGVVGTIPFREGTLVSPQLARPLTTVSDNSRMYVYFSMNENMLLDMVSRYGSMDAALDSLPDVGLRLSNGEEYPIKGRIESISGVINTSTGTVSLRAVFPNPGGLLHSGASGSIVMPQIYRQCVMVPKSATYEVQDKMFVYRVEDGLAVSTPIQVAPVGTMDQWVVISGLSQGDEIVIEGVALLRDGQKVKNI